MTQRDDFVRCAREQVGKRYVWATAGPNTFDCSGLVAYCYQQATGKAITRSSYDQIKLGKEIDIADTSIGDLAFWDTEHDGRAGHVAIFIGDDTVVHALNPQRGVVESDFYANMGGPLIASRRIFLPADSSSVENPAPIEESRPKARRRQNRRRRTNL